MPIDTSIKYGNDLESPVVQPGWSVDSDGFGMLQSTVKFKWAKIYTAQFPNWFHRGRSHPSDDYSQLKLFKATMTEEKGQVVSIVAEYCGLATNGGGESGTDYNGRGYSDPQIMMTGAAAAESIQAHPNFITINALNWGDVPPLAGHPPALGGFDSNLTTNPNRAAWTPKVAGGGLINNCQFIGFLPNQDPTDETPNLKAGIKSYYKPQMTLRVLIYFTEEEQALDRASIVGFVTNGGAYYLPEAYKAFAYSSSPYAGTFNYTDPWTEKIHKSFLVTNASVERFGALWKVTADLMLSGLGGWDKDVYIDSSLG
jgi:hypothetical protein